VRLPRPPRDESPLLDNEARQHGLTFDGYVNFLMTRSSATDFIERRGRPAATLRKWLREGTGTLFDGEERLLRFGGYIWYLRPL
jgi:hypothetical protein